MPQERYRHTNKIDYLGDFPGARRERDVVVVELNGVNVEEGIPISALPNQSGDAAGQEGLAPDEDESIAAFHVPSATRLMGQVSADNEFSVEVVWMTSNMEEIRSETIESADGNEWVEFDLPARASRLEVVVRNESDGDIVVDYTVHMT